MAENGSGGTEEKDLVIDLRAFRPRPRGTLLLEVPHEGRTAERAYPVMSLMDIPGDDLLDFLEIDTDLPKKKMSEQVAIARRQIKLLVPTLEAGILNAIPMSELLRARDEALGISGPPVGAGEGPGSGSSSPSSAASTAGVPAS